MITIAAITSRLSAALGNLEVVLRFARLSIHHHGSVRKALIVLGWLGATAATTLVAYLAVDAAGSRVGDRPLATVVAPDSGSSTLATASTSTTTSTTPTPATTDNTTASISTVTTADTTTSAAVWQQQTVNSAAGKIVVSYRPEEVRLESVAPLAGYAYDVEDAGPPEVRVEFEGPLRVEIRVRWRDGELVTEIDEDS
jgi:hypothetical protein